MLSNGFDAPLHLRLKPSRQLFSFQLTILVLAFIAIAIPTSILLPVRIGLGVLLVANMIILFMLYKRQASFHMQLVWHRQSGWEEVKISKLSGVIEKQLWSSQQFMVDKSLFILFKLLSENKQKQILIFKDQCENPDDFRRLRVLLDCLSEVPEQQKRFNMKLSDIRKND